ncbi:MAG: hypothetical protein IT384_30585 [Deltaproteobacteria bacterium]|nr:hypothetical protein [Deltaproteobacteria bacterium]
MPAAFSIARDAAALIPATGEMLPPPLEDEIRRAIAALEQTTGRRFGDPARPLLLSVRSGSAASMPGMLTTILNVGASAPVLDGLTAMADRRFALDCRARLLRSFGAGVLEAHGAPPTKAEPVPLGSLTEAALSALIDEYGRALLEETDRVVPDDPWEQLRQAVIAVFASWSSERARSYRAASGIPADLGTAVTICQMIFGNLDARSGSGVVFTRNPSSGAKGAYGEYLLVAQGEDVVSGAVTPLPINESSGPPRGEETLEQRMPEIYRELIDRAAQIERARKAPQEIEFTIERGRLWILQARFAEQSPKGSIHTAVSMVDEGLLTPREALRWVDPKTVAKVAETAIDLRTAPVELARGLPAAAGVESGQVVFTRHEAETRAKRGVSVILVRVETTPDDIAAIRFAKGIVTARGGTTSHAAVVARALGKACIVGTHELNIDLPGRSFTARGRRIREGEVITLDGRTGRISLGQSEVTGAARSPELDRLLTFADEARRLRARALVSDPSQLAEAFRLGAEGLVARLEGRPQAAIGPLLSAAEGRPLTLLLPVEHAALSAEDLRLISDRAKVHHTTVEIALEVTTTLELDGRLNELRAKIEGAGAAAPIQWAVIVRSIAAARAIQPLVDRVDLLIFDADALLHAGPASTAPLDEALSAAFGSPAAGSRAVAAIGTHAAESIVVRWAHGAALRFIAAPPSALMALRLAAGRAACAAESECAPESEPS